MKIKIRQSQASKAQLMDEYERRIVLWHKWLISGKSAAQFFDSCKKDNQE